jgi:hypothetical protein
MVSDIILLAVYVSSYTNIIFNNNLDNNKLLILR